LPVELGQAGGKTTCSCGNLVDVPTLRKLRHLPLDESKSVRPAGSTWSARKGVMTASLLLAGGLTLVNAWSWFTQPVVPVFDAASYQRDVVEQRLKNLTPSQSWDLWVGYYKPLAERGFSYLERADRAQIESVIVQRQSLRRTLWIVVAIAAISAAAAAFWPKSPEVTSRRND
jgi:hypothetical protein